MNETDYNPSAHHRFRAGQPIGPGADKFLGSWQSEDIHQLIKWARRHQKSNAIVIKIWQSTLDSPPGRLPFLWQGNPAEFLNFISESDKPAQKTLL